MFIATSGDKFMQWNLNSCKTEMRQLTPIATEFLHCDSPGLVLNITFIHFRDAHTQIDIVCSYHFKAELTSIVETNRQFTQTNESLILGAFRAALVGSMILDEPMRSGIFIVRIYQLQRTNNHFTSCFCAEGSDVQHWQMQRRNVTSPQ